MRLLLIFLVTSAAAQSVHLQHSHTTESLRGVSAVSRQIAWASGTHGTYLRTTNGGHNWTPAQVPDAANVDFRAVVAFSADEAFLMSAGPGDLSRIYHTTDAGRHWQLQFTNTNPKGFFDSMAFWDSEQGVVLGDPVPDENGKLKFELVLTNDGGKSWRQLPAAQLPEALPGEGAFAASNSCISILSTQPWKSGALAPALSDRATRGSRTGPRQPGEHKEASPADANIWFATGGTAARVFHSPDRGRTWEVHETPILHGADSEGIFSIAFHNDLDGVIAGGDYKRPKFDGPNLAFTHDGGKTWEVADVHPQAYFSAVAYGYGKESAQRVFVIGPEVVYDLLPRKGARPVRKHEASSLGFNALSAFSSGGALVVGTKGAIAVIP